MNLHAKVGALIHHHTSLAGLGDVKCLYLVVGHAVGYFVPKLRRLYRKEIEKGKRRLNRRCSYSLPLLREPNLRLTSASS